MASRNKFSKALKHLKNKSIDEKLELLEAIPTNNTAGIFVDEPGTFDTEETPADIDSPLDLDQDGDGGEDYSGNDTTGLFETDGTIRSIEPPGDTSYILGPMISMWYAWANTTQIGYVRQSDRKMVNLGRISGQIENWDGETGFVSYGQMSVEQAVWYQGQQRADYRAFYPGPPSNPADQYGRYIGSIISASKSSTPGSREVFIPGTNISFDPSDVLSLLLGTDDSGMFDFFDNLLGNITDALGITDAIDGAFTAGKTFLAYLTNQLPDVVDNNFLGQDFVDKAFTDMVLTTDRNGNPISQVRDFVIGSGQNPTYNPQTNQIEVNFNYDFDTNAQAIAKEPEKYNYKPGLNRLLMNVAALTGGDYGLDSTPILGAGALISIAKAMGGGEQTPGKITISPADLQQQNPTLFNQLVNRGDFSQDAVNKPSQQRKAPQDGAKLDPKAAMEALKQNGPPELKMALEPSMDNFKQLSPQQQKTMMKNIEKRYRESQDSYADRFKGDELEGLRRMTRQNIEARRKAVKTEFKDGYRITTTKTFYGKPYVSKVPLFPTSQRSTSSGRTVYPVYRGGRVVGGTYGPSTGRTTATGRTNVTGRTNATGRTNVTGVTNATGNTTSTGVTNDVTDKTQQGSDDSQSTGNPFADKYGLPADYKDKLGKAQAYFQNNLNGVGYRTLGFTEPERMDALYDIAFKKQGFTDKQIETIKKEKLLVTKYGKSPSLKAKEERAKREAEEAAKERERQAQQQSNLGGNRRVTFNTFNNQSQSSGGLRGGSRSYMNIRVGDTTSSNTNNFGKDYGKIAQGDKRKMPDHVRDSIKRQYKGGSDYSIEDMKNIINWQKKMQASGSFDQIASARGPYGEPGADKPFTRRGYKDKDGKFVDFDNPATWPKIPKARQPKRKTPLVAQHEPLGIVLTENQKRILREIKKPVKVKEMPKSFKVKPTGRLNKNKSVGVDMMNIPDTPTQYKPLTNIWRKKDYAANVRASQEKKNEVLELLGAAEHHWTYLTEERRKKKQEEVNERLSISFDLEMQELYEKHKVNEVKITKAMSVYKKEPGLKPELPQEPPPQPDPMTGYHPKVGKHYKHNKLDPQSAEFMPLTGNPEIDANIEKARNKKERDRKLKILLGKSTGTPKKNKKGLKEGMTSSGMFFSTLPAEGDVDLAQFNDPVIALGSNSGFSQTGNNYTFGAGTPGVEPAVTSSLSFDTNTAIYDTIVFDFVNSGVIDELRFVTGDQGGLSTYNISTSSGTKTIRLLPVDRKKLISVAWSIKRSEGGELGTNKILNVRFQRRTPMNVFIGLDDPTANAFIRDGQLENLSSSEKKKKLEDMLKASLTYMNIKVGDVTPKTATKIAEYVPQMSYAEIAQGLPYTDLDDAFDDPYYKGPPPDLDDDSDFDPDDFEYARATTQVAHYEPQGEVISEKKRLKSPKDLTDKLPGYYDGKPSPLGFPIVEPPEMKDGMHPDLVDGKKVAKRFNRLDPISAKAMPPTGNPYIDKKVKAAAKKPK